MDADPNNTGPFTMLPHKHVALCFRPGSKIIGLRSLTIASKNESFDASIQFSDDLRP